MAPQSNICAVAVCHQNFVIDQPEKHSSIRREALT